MKKNSPQWGQQSRFFLPNEDAQMVRTALTCLPRPLQNPVFVGGSGMVLLDALADMANVEQVTFVDISEFQVAYFKSLLLGMKSSADPAELQEWFAEIVYPQLHDHFSSGRNQNYSLEQVMGAMRELFRIRFFFEPDSFGRVKTATACIQSMATDIVSYLCDTENRYDFVYLSNVPDYLPEQQLPVLFRTCARQAAPIYLLLTETCPNPSSVRQFWEDAGYQEHSGSAGLTDQNRALGSFTLQRSWNRKGRIVLLVPEV